MCQRHRAPAATSPARPELLPGPAAAPWTGAVTILLCSIASGAEAQAQPPANSQTPPVGQGQARAPAEVIPRQQLIEDARRLAEVLESTHPDAAVGDGYTYEQLRQMDFDPNTVVLLVTSET